MPKVSRLVSLAGLLAALSTVLAATAPAQAAELETTAALEVQTLRALDVSRQIDGLVAASVVTLADGSRLEAGSAIVVGDRIVSGAVENTLGETLVLSFGDGCPILLLPGEQVTIAEGELVLSTHECVCKCTCSGEGFSEPYTVDAPCDGTDNCPALNGKDCLVFVDGELKEGTASGCTFKMVPKRAATPAPLGQ